MLKLQRSSISHIPCLAQEMPQLRQHMVTGTDIKTFDRTLIIKRCFFSVWWLCCFVFEKSQVQIWALRPLSPTEVNCSSSKENLVNIRRWVKTDSFRTFSSLFFLVGPTFLSGPSPPSIFKFIPHKYFYYSSLHLNCGQRQP
jgi:hypothetical protein